MFGSLEPANISQPIPKGHGQTTDPEAIQTGKPLRSESSAGICATLSSSPQVLWKNTISTSPTETAQLFHRQMGLQGCGAGLFGGSCTVVLFPGILPGRPVNLQLFVFKIEIEKGWE